MATKVFYFYKRADSAVAPWTLTYSSALESLVFPAIDAVPKTSGDITTYLDWTRPGYAFMGWDTEEDGTGTRYLPEDSTAIALAPTNYYAQWVEIQPVVTISYNNNVIFEASSTTGTQVLTTQNSFLTDNITVHYTGGGAATQSVTVTPRTLSQTITPDSGYIGFNPVIVEAISPIKYAATYTPTTTNQTIASNQWLGGVQTIKGDANLVAENIKNGVSIFGVTGTYAGGGGGGGDFAGLVQRTITNASDSTITTIGNYAFYNCPSLTTISFPNCTTVGTYAFYNCSSLTAASFPSCTTVGTYAFYYCYKLTTISFPKCASIGGSAFRSCAKITEALFPSCTSIGAYAFYGCYSLTTASFPKCTYVGSHAFRLCYHLLSLYILTSTVPTLSGTSVFTSTPIGGYCTSTGGVYGSIFVKESLLASFQTATRWSTYSARMVGLTDEQIAALG